MRNLVKAITGIILFTRFISVAHAQLSVDGIPPGFADNHLKSTIQTVSLSPPDYELLKRQDDSLSSMGTPERMGVSISTRLTIENSGQWINTENESIWRLNIKVDGATGIGLYFENFRLNKEDKLYIYSQDKTHLIGAFSEINNRQSGLFATEPVKGESIIVELVHPKNTVFESAFTINEIMVVYTPMSFSTERAENASRQLKETIGDSDECEVSTNCPEGDNWRDQINGVVRIMVKIGGAAFWCTGSIMNNTALDFSPLILTADHCASSNNVYATPANVALWIFYFRHEAFSCSNDTPVGTRSLTGAVKLASSTPTGNDGSDFYLLELFDDIPVSYEPYYQGWSARNELSNAGVSIHHPAGDVKKISTYTTPLELSQWGNTPETHLMVKWSETQNGHGVTEGGSSGSPLFNSDKMVIGQLTGGESDCTNLNGLDHYGRFYYSWDKNGLDDSTRLKPWLDPLNTGLNTLDGSYNTKAAIAQFTANQMIIPVGSYIQFTDISQNNPTTWQWEFEGGEPSESSSQQPQRVFYDKLGRYEVLLTVSNEFGTDTMSMEISVVPVIYPNPTRNNIYILSGDIENEHHISINDLTGRLVADFNIPVNTSSFEYSFIPHPAGVYLITIKSNGNEEHYKVLYTPR